MFWEDAFKAPYMLFTCGGSIHPLQSRGRFCFLAGAAPPRYKGQSILSEGPEVKIADLSQQRVRSTCRRLSRTLPITHVGTNTNVHLLISLFFNWHYPSYTNPDWKSLVILALSHAAHLITHWLPSPVPWLHQMISYSLELIHLFN